MKKMLKIFLLPFALISLLSSCEPTSDVLQIALDIEDEGRYDETNEKNDFIQRIIRNVVRTNGKVYIFEQNEIPNGTQIAARLRY